MPTLLFVQIHLLSFLSATVHRARHHRDENGQATAEYALVLLGAAAIAGLFIAWATKTNAPGKLLDTIFDKVLVRAESQ